MEHKTFVGAEIGKAIASIEKLTKSLVVTSKADEEKETDLIAVCTAVP